MDRLSTTTTPSEVSAAHSTPPTSTTSTPRAASDVSMLDHDDDDSSSEGAESSVVSSSEDSGSGSDSESDQATGNGPPNGHICEPEEEHDRYKQREESDEDGEPSSPPIITLGGPTKPIMQLPSSTRRDASDLSARLSAFLPQLAAANQCLRPDQSLENVDEHGAYIEMNLGLGVLEEKRGDHDDESGEGESSDENADEIDGAMNGGEIENDGLSKDRGEVDILGTLLGKKGRSKKKAGIEEMSGE